jgi:hypothetical protein
LVRFQQHLFLFNKEINMQISVIATSVATKINKANKPYQELEVTYKNLTFNKVESKKCFSFGAQEGAFKALSGAKQGDVFEVTVVKNAAGFNDWTACVQAAPGTEVAAQNNQTGAIMGAGSINAGGKSVQVKSTYETPEERAIKQRYIIKQSSLSGAINLLTVGAKSPPATEAVLALADTLVAYVMETPEQVVQGDLFKMENDVEVM